MTLVAAVGTFIAGFDQLVEAADRACAVLGIDGFAQIGRSAVIPHAMRWQRFLPQAELTEQFGQASVVVCHAGMGVVGEAMRAGARIILFPRQGQTRKGHPANDQSEFAQVIAQRHGLAVCTDGVALTEMVRAALSQPERRSYRLDSDVPTILRHWLAGRGQPDPR